MSTDITNDDTTHIWDRIDINIFGENTKKAPKICNNCDRIEKNNENFKKCSACCVSVYCSEECQKIHWKIMHKKYCSTLIPFKDKEEKEEVRTFQLTFKLYYSKYLRKIMNYTNYAAIFYDGDYFKYWRVNDFVDKSSYLISRITEQEYLNECDKHNWDKSTDHWKYFIGQSINRVRIYKPNI